MSSRNEALILAVDAGGSFIKYVLCRLDGSPEKSSRNSLPVDSDADAETILSVFDMVYEQALESAAVFGKTIAAVGVSFPGPFDYASGVSLMKHKFASLYGVSIALRIERYGIPVAFEHDAISFLIGEQENGAARGFSHAALCTLGTGLGYACMADGSILRNELGSPHLGLFREPLRDGIVEDYVSARAIAGRWRKICRPEESGLTVKEIGNLAERGDERARRIYADTGRYLGEALFAEMRLRETECLVLGGQIARSFDFIAPALREVLSACPGLRKVARAENINYAALIGVALKASKSIGVE